MENNNKELEQFFDDQLAEIQAEQAKNLKKSKNKKKGLVPAIIALILAAATLVTVVLWPKKKDNSKGNTPTTSTVTPKEEVSVDDLGVKFENPTLEEEKEYGEVTGNVNKEEIVEKDDTLWKDEDAANKSEQVGKNEIDDKDGTLEVKPNGDVFVKDEDYEIEKEDGTIVDGTITEDDKTNGEIGSNDTILPPGYVHDENLDKDVIEEDANKFVYSDADYYDSTGALIYSKGELISKEDLEMAKQSLTTIKPVIETKPEETVPEVQPEETPVVDEGVINPNGTYTIYGVTYMSKEDYQQFLLYPEQYGYYNGMVLSLEDIEAMFKESQKSK